MLQFEPHRQRLCEGGTWCEHRQIDVQKERAAPPRCNTVVTMTSYARCGMRRAACGCVGIHAARDHTSTRLRMYDCTRKRVATPMRSCTAGWSGLGGWQSQSRDQSRASGLMRMLPSHDRIPRAHLISVCLVRARLHTAWAPLTTAYTRTPCPPSPDLTAAYTPHERKHAFPSARGGREC